MIKLIEAFFALIPKLVVRLGELMGWENKDFTELSYLPTDAPVEPQNAPGQELSPNTPPASSENIPPSNGQIKPHLTDICTAMRNFEGKPGDPNYRNNNPLNCKFYYGGYLPIYEPVKMSPAGFAIFKDYQTGWLYGFNELKNKIKHHPEWTLLDMITDHAPPSDNNPSVIYAETVAKAVGVDKLFPVKNIVLD